MMKRILILIMAMLITTAARSAETSKGVILRATNPMPAVAQPALQKTANPPQINLQPIADIQTIGFPDNYLQVYQPYELSKSEVLFSQTKAWINATNPTGGYLPGSRGPNQLVIYTPSYGTRTNTNEFGAEAVIQGNTVIELSGADSMIPCDGVVISGHGKAKTWMNSSISVGTKVYIDTTTNLIYTYTTSDSYLFESEKKINEAQQMIDFYKINAPDYNWKVPNSYISDAKEYLKRAQKNTDEVQQYSKLAIEAANDALKSVIPYKSGELKGVWVRPVEKTEIDIINTINTIQNAGIDNIFLETYYHGKTIFPSKTMTAYGFTPQYEQFSGIDPLKIWITEAHKRNMKVHIWFETFYVGNTNPKDNPNSILSMNPSWGNKTKKDYASLEPTKSSSEHNGYFLDPANPFVQDFLMKLITEIVTDYKPDGINLDYIRYPNAVAPNEASSWGFTEFARQEFNTIFCIDPLELTASSIQMSDWNNYRRDKVTNFVRKVGALGKEKNIYTSAVIFPDRQAALTSKQQDWKIWSTRGYLQGFTPLFLTCDSKTANAMMQDVINAKSPATDFYAGLFVTFMNGSEEDLIRQIHEARKLNANGVIIFDYAHMSPKYAKTLATSVFAAKSPIRITTPVVIEPVKVEKKKRWWQRK